MPRRRLIVKGAPEDLLRLSGQYQDADGKEKPLDPATRSVFQATLDALGAQGFRALGIASRLVDSTHETAAISDEADLVFAGFAVFLDPPKSSAGATIRAMAEAGITVKVLTGDNELVSRHVFAEIGVPVTGVLTGDALEHLPEEALIGQLSRVNLFCRVNPQQKHRVLLALKRLGNVVGFLGDGINDAPALHAADVGISVDGAADVARAAADLILLEHDLSVVRDAVVAGRATVQNVSKYVLMGASSNFGNMFSMAGATLILPFLPMLPIQILLNNLIYNVSEIAIPFDSVDPEVVVGPVKWDIKLIERFMLVFGPVSSIFDFVTFYAMLVFFGAGEALFQTGWFIESMTTQTLVVFCIRTRRLCLRSKPCRFLVAMNLGAVALAIILPLVPWGRWFGFVTPPPLFFVFLVGATTVYLGLVEVTKGRVLPFHGRAIIETREMSRRERHRTGHTGWLRAAIDSGPHSGSRGGVWHPQQCPDRGDRRACRGSQVNGCRRVCIGAFAEGHRTGGSDTGAHGASYRRQGRASGTGGDLCCLRPRSSACRPGHETTDGA